MMKDQGKSRALELASAEEVVLARKAGWRGRLS